MLRVEGLSAGYGDMQVLRDVSLDIGQGEAVALLGANGAGKTTLLRVITGLLPPSAGRVMFRGAPITGAAAHRIVELGLIMVPEGRALFPFMTVEENLELGSYSARARPQRKRSFDRVFALLPKLAERRRQMSGSLSGGEQQMCAIGRGLMALPELLLLDEPSLGLSPLIVQDIFGLITTLRGEGITVLLVEQHVKQALARTDRGLVLENGRISVAGKSADLLTNTAVRTAYMGHRH